MKNALKLNIGSRLRHRIEKFFPERRIFVRTDNETRFVRLGAGVQITAAIGGALFLGWSMLATSIVLMDQIGADNFRDQAKRDQTLFEERLNALAAERDAREAEALSAQERFNSALSQFSEIQTRLLWSENRRRELETGLDVVHAKLRDSLVAQQSARQQLANAETSINGNGTGLPLMGEQELTGTLEVVANRLRSTAEERHEIQQEMAVASDRAGELELELQLMREQNDQIFRQLEDAMTVSVEPLERMFSAAGLSTDRLLNQVRRGYEGKGGPLTPISFSTTSNPLTADVSRANRILEEMDELNLYRVAANRAPFASPVLQSFRFTSQFGYRRDPKTGGRRMHNGVDFAASTGTPIHATADGVVIFAGWQSGYGRLVKIQHDFGIETRYAHNTRIRVKVGDRVSRGQHISDMGATGRVTGVHLHYEVRVGGRPVNPMNFIRAARDVF